MGYLKNLFSTYRCKRCGERDPKKVTYAPERDIYICKLCIELEDAQATARDTARVYAQHQYMRLMQAAQQAQMAAPAPVDLSQLNNQTGSHTHGGHRSTSAQVYGSSVGASGVSAGFTLFPSAFSSANYAQHTSTVENAGIRAGEIIAWRVWRVTPHNFLSPYPDQMEDGLYSMACDLRWIPGKPMGLIDINRIRCGKPPHIAQAFVNYPEVDTKLMVSHWGNGVHGFKSLDEACQQYLPASNYVFGTVKLWGEVIEHEVGYRAEWGIINSLDQSSASNAVKILDHYRKMYRVEGVDGNNCEIG